MQKIYLLVLLWTFVGLAKSNFTEIDFTSTKRIHTAGSGLFIDARERKSYKRGTILGAISIPVRRFKRMRRFLPQKKSSKLVVFCGGIKCDKSTTLAKLIAQEGYNHVYVYRGGFLEWSQKGQETMLSAIHCRSSKQPSPKPIILQGVSIQPGDETGMINPKWFAKAWKTGTVSPHIQLVDVRKISEYRDGHLTGALHIPWHSDTGRIDSSLFPSEKLTLLYCNTGTLSSDAYDSLDEETAKRVLFLDAVVKCRKGTCKIAPNTY